MWRARYEQVAKSSLCSLANGALCRLCSLAKVALCRVCSLQMLLFAAFLDKLVLPKNQSIATQEQHRQRSAILSSLRHFVAALSAGNAFARSASAEVLIAPIFEKEKKKKKKKAYVSECIIKLKIPTIERKVAKTMGDTH